MMNKTQRVAISISIWIRRARSSPSRANPSVSGRGHPTVPLVRWRSRRPLRPNRPLRLRPRSLRLRPRSLCQKSQLLRKLPRRASKASLFHSHPPLPSGDGEWKVLGQFCMCRAQRCNEQRCSQRSRHIGTRGIFKRRSGVTGSLELEMNRNGLVYVIVHSGLLCYHYA
jgi:hypothetical protein